MQAQIEQALEHPGTGPDAAPFVQSLFRDQRRECPRTPVHVRGDLPDWLRGAYLRIGPALFDLPAMRASHWFEGLGMLARFELGPEGCFFTARHLRSRNYAAASRPPPFGRLEPVMARLRSWMGGRPPYDNAAVNIGPFAGGVMTMTESPHRLWVDPVSLEVFGPVTHHDEVRGHFTTAHPVYDHARQTTFNFLTEFGKDSTYHLYALGYASRSRRLVASLPAERPAYMHSFAATRDHLILVECPLFIQPLRLRFGVGFLYDYVRWEPSAGTRVRAIHKDSGRVDVDARLEPFFVFHHVAARHSGSTFELDLVAYEDPGILFELTLDQLHRSPPLGTGQLRRYVVTEGGSVERRDLAEERLELPRTDPRRQHHALRYVYGVGNAKVGGFTDQLVKVDAERGHAKVWRDPGLFPGEPVFLPRPGGSAEDDGVVLSLAVDGPRDRSTLLVLDAASWSERARLEAPLRVPQGFHGELLAPEGSELATGPGGCWASR